jgi:hypothetical protein
MEERADGVAFTLPPVGYRDLWRQAGFALSLGAAGLLVLLGDCCCCSSLVSVLLGTLGLLIFAGWLVNARMEGAVLIVGDRLLIWNTYPGTRVATGIDEARADIVTVHALNALNGITVVTPTTDYRFFPYRDPEELRWIAAMVRQRLGLPEERPPAANELRVCYAGMVWPEPVPGILGVRPEELTLRHPFARLPHLTFRPRKPSLLRQAFPGTGNSIVVLDPVEIILRQRPDEPACLEIAPVTPFYRRRGYFFLPGIVDGKQRIVGSWTWKRVELTIWCEYGEALQQALATFWGAKPG